MFPSVLFVTIPNFLRKQYLDRYSNRGTPDWRLDRLCLCFPGRYDIIELHLHALYTPSCLGTDTTSLCHLLDKCRIELSHRILAVQVMAAITKMAYNFLNLYNGSMYTTKQMCTVMKYFLFCLWFKISLRWFIYRPVMALTYKRPSHSIASLDSHRLLLLHHSWHGSSKQQWRVYPISVMAVRFTSD
jgi:hypothetical protein